MSKKIERRTQSVYMHDLFLLSGGDVWFVSFKTKMHKFTKFELMSFLGNVTHH